MYKLMQSKITEQIDIVQKQIDGALLSIPFSLDNTDYQQYLLWKSEGNEPLPADE